MNRRDLLKAAPAALIVGSVPAAAASEASIMASLYRQWLSAKEAYNDYDGFDNEQELALYGEVAAIEDEIIDTPPKCVQDYAYKLIILNGFAALEGLPSGDAMLAEAHALIGSSV